MTASAVVTRTEFDELAARVERDSVSRELIVGLTRQTESLLEEMRLFRDDQQLLYALVKQQGQTLKELHSHTGRLEQMTDDLNDRVDGLETGLMALDQRVSRIETDISELKVDVSQLKTDVSQLNTDMGQLKQDNADIKSTLALILEKLS